MSGRLRIMIVDDDESTRSVMERVLEGAGHTVWTAAEGTEALLTLTESPADVVVTDIFMHGTDGLETIRELRATSPATKIIAVTGYAGVSDALRDAKDSGAHLTLRKPVTAQQLVAAIHAVSAPPVPPSQP